MSILLFILHDEWYQFFVSLTLLVSLCSWYFGFYMASVFLIFCFSLQQSAFFVSYCFWSLPKVDLFLDQYLFLSIQWSYLTIPKVFFFDQWLFYSQILLVFILLLILYAYICYVLSELLLFQLNTLLSECDLQPRSLFLSSFLW